MTINAYEARFNVAKSQEKATKTEEKSLSKILKPMLKRIKKASKAGKSS
jgi:CRISPR/Cas system CSM-associated protein Csm2 small subunit